MAAEVYTTLIHPGTWVICFHQVFFSLFHIVLSIILLPRGGMPIRVEGTNKGGVGNGVFCTARNSRLPLRCWVGIRKGGTKVV